MDIAVLSDIHGNYIALEKCISCALSQGIRSFIFLGDYAGELAYPDRTMRMLYELEEKYECWFIKGNKENYWLEYQADGEKGWKKFDSTTGSLVYTYSHLTEKDLEFYRELPFCRKLTFSDLPSIIICHGSPYKVNEKMLPNKERTYEIIDMTDASVILCGHTHRQGKITHNEKCVLNPGSVGVAIGSGGKAQFMILHGKDGQWEEEFFSLFYDTEKVISELHEAELDHYAPCWCLVTEHLLRTGSVPHSEVLSRAMILCEAAEGSCSWPEVPEKYWEQAVKEMLCVSEV